MGKSATGNRKGEKEERDRQKMKERFHILLYTSG